MAHDPSDEKPAGWSNEAILALVAVLLTIVLPCATYIIRCELPYLSRWRLTFPWDNQPSDHRNKKPALLPLFHFDSPFDASMRETLEWRELSSLRVRRPLEENAGG